MLTCREDRPLRWPVRRRWHQPRHFPMVEEELGSWKEPSGSEWHRCLLLDLTSHSAVLGKLLSVDVIPIEVTMSLLDSKVGNV